MKDEKKLENKGKSGFRFETKADQAAEKKKKQTPEEEQEEAVDQPASENEPDAPAAEVLEEDEPSWLEKVVEELDLDIPQQISKVPDKDLLAVKGVGPATLEDIRALFPFKKSNRLLGPER